MTWIRQCSYAHHLCCASARTEGSSTRSKTASVSQVSSRTARESPLHYTLGGLQCQGHSTSFLGVHMYFSGSEKWAYAPLIGRACSRTSVTAHATSLSQKGAFAPSRCLLETHCDDNRTVITIHQFLNFFVLHKPNITIAFREFARIAIKVI